MKIKLYLTMWAFQLNHVRPEQLQDVNEIVDRCSFSKSLPGENSEQFVVGEMEVDVELELVPRDEMLGRAAVALRQKAAGIRAAARVEAARYDDQADQLLAIEHKP